ncbi:MAG TPA: hypothetical protein VK210_17890 [Terriglobia bacterium]|nr:hypothetical protein [Terriglobia bacterium]
MKFRIPMLGCLQWGLGVVMMIALLAAGTVQAQVPPLVEAELVKMGRVVDPGCTGKLYRPLFGKNDYNTYWPVDAASPNKNIKLYPGVTMTRDVSYGPQPKDLIDIFMPDKGGGNRTVLIFVPGGAGNKIEQQSVESNMFYDNIGMWAANNGMLGITVQRGGSAAGQNLALVIQWLQANAAKYKGNSNDMFLMAHSAGTQSLGQYIGRPDLYGIGVKGAIFLGGLPNLGIGGGGGGGRGGGGAPAANPPTCVLPGGSQAGVIRGPSSPLPDQGATAAARRKEQASTVYWNWDGKQWVSTGVTPPAPTAAGAGGGGGRGGGGAGGGGGRGGAGGGAPPAAAGAPAAPPAFTLLDGFKTTRTAIALGYGEIDLDATAINGPGTQSVAIHDELCKLEGPKPKDGVGHCPTLMWFKGESHMSEVFSFGSIDKTVSEPVLAFISQHH